MSSTLLGNVETKGCEGTNIISSSSPLVTPKPINDSSATASRISSSSSDDSLSGRSSPVDSLVPAAGPMRVQVEEAAGSLHQLSISDSGESEKAHNSHSSTDLKEQSGGKRAANTRISESSLHCTINDDRAKGRISLVEGLYTSISARELPIDDNEAWQLPPPKKRIHALQDIKETYPGRKRMRLRHRRSLNSPTSKTTCERVTIPVKRSVEQQVFHRLRNANPIFCPSNLVSSDKDASLAVLYRWLRVRFAAGLIRSSLSLLHDMLSKGYDDARNLLQELHDEDEESRDLIQQLFQIRNRLAGIWCIYAHFILELGYQALYGKDTSNDECTPVAAPLKGKSRRSPHLETFISPGRRRRRSAQPCSSRSKSLSCDEAPLGDIESSLKTLKRRRQIKSPPRANPAMQQNNASLQDIQDHAISILMAARNCPLVGNHTFVALSLGRMIVSGLALDASSESPSLKVSSERIHTAITSAIAACWDAMDICHNKRETNQRFASTQDATISIEFLSHFDYAVHRLHKEPRLSGEEIESSMHSVLELPSRLMGALNVQNSVVCDRNTIRALCVELNRLSHLEERILTIPGLGLQPSPGDTLLNELPLFSSFDSFHHVVDEPRPHSKCMNVERITKPLAGSAYPGDGTVIWKW